MNTVLSVIKTVVSLMPVVIELIKTVEAAVPDGGVGKQKLELVKAALEKVFATATDLTATFQQVWPVMESIVGSLVAIFNAVGIFKKKTD
jgi:hypothetical protein